MNIRADSATMANEQMSDGLIELDELEEALAAMGNTPNVEENGTKRETGTADAILDSPTIKAPRRPEKTRPRSKSATGVRPDPRNHSSSRNGPLPAHESNALRSTGAPPRSSPGADNAPRAQEEKDQLPKYISRRSGPDDHPETKITHQGHRGITQDGVGRSFVERVRKPIREPDIEEMYLELQHQRRTAQLALRESEYYKQVARSLHKELEDCKKDLWTAEDEKKALGQQILDLGTVAEGVTDEVLRRIFQNAIGCAVESHSKVFGKPTGDDHDRLEKLLSPECTQLLRQFGRKYYHSLLASALFKETVEAVGKRYIVGAASGISKLTRGLGVEIDTRGSLTFLQILEEILHLPSIGVPQRDINVWRSSFTKLLQHIPEVNEVANSGSKTSAESELSKLVDEVWTKLEPHIPPGDKGRRSLQKLLKFQANLRLKTCMSLASYELKFHEPGTQFNVSTMSIVDVTEGECEDDELHRLDSESCGRKLVVGFCFYPALYKWGNDRGFDMEKGHVVARATVLPVYDDDLLVRQHILEGKSS
ncbi:hypothetical protein ACO22_06405 [Paracoccidioides brasiliensis]|uniref:Uncharacterized protein n=1 Tax=Paracoccidioides brasiliensis TaxID=121759 RepID=A0A1D2J7K2_PARBR|nr:hypothetical protein ACO22_06405 [Paracoccidioides brasiliensis]